MLWLLAIYDQFEKYTKDITILHLSNLKFTKISQRGGGHLLPLDPSPQDGDYLSHALPPYQNTLAPPLRPETYVHYFVFEGKPLIPIQRIYTLLYKIYNLQIFTRKFSLKI